LRWIASRSPSATQTGASAALRNFTGLRASSASNIASSRVNVLIRAVRCSCVIDPSFTGHAPGDRREHLAGDARSADFNVNLARRIVSFDDEALLPSRDGLAAQGHWLVTVIANIGVTRLDRRRSLQDGYLPLPGVLRLPGRSASPALRR
jgi:hypothetical protein